MLCKHSHPIYILTFDHLVIRDHHFMLNSIHRLLAYHCTESGKSRMIVQSILYFVADCLFTAQVHYILCF